MIEQKKLLDVNNIKKQKVRIVRFKFAIMFFIFLLQGGNKLPYKCTEPLKGQGEGKKIRGGRKNDMSMLLFSRKIRLCRM